MEPVSAQWAPSGVVTNKVDSNIQPDFREAVISNGICSGDFIQVNGAAFSNQHTMIVGAIQNDGIWVFDSNFVSDLTEGYHFITYESFAKNADNFTIYRIK